MLYLKRICFDLPVYPFRCNQNLRYLRLHWPGFKYSNVDRKSNNYRSIVWKLTSRECFRGCRRRFGCWNTRSPHIWYLRGRTTDTWRCSTGTPGRFSWQPMLYWVFDYRRRDLVGCDRRLISDWHYANIVLLNQVQSPCQMRIALSNNEKQENVW